MTTPTTKRIRYFVGTCDEPVLDVFASSAKEAVEEFLIHMGWDTDPEYYDGCSIYVVAASSTTEYVLHSQSKYTVEKAK